jgi:hypothetical protein
MNGKKGYCEAYLGFYFIKKSLLILGIEIASG